MATLTITFDKPVSGLTLSDIDAPNCTLSNLLSMDGKVWVADIEPLRGINDVTNVITLNFTTEGVTTSDNYIVITGNDDEQSQYNNPRPRDIWWNK